MSPKTKRLRIMAGPNGSGKSTILKAIKSKFYSGPFVNADEIERSYREKKLVNTISDFDLIVQEEEFTHFLETFGKSWMDKAKLEGQSIGVKPKEGILVVDDSPSPYDAAITADYIRWALIEKGETFTFETVLSHPSKVNFLRNSLSKGYHNYLYFICTIDPQINISRVAQRVQFGGHNVPVERIENRYWKSLEVLSQLIPLCHRVFLFDNSSEERTMEPVASIEPDRSLRIQLENVPWWVEEYVIQRLYK